MIRKWCLKTWCPLKCPLQLQVRRLVPWSPGAQTHGKHSPADVSSWGAAFQSRCEWCPILSGEVPRNQSTHRFLDFCLVLSWLSAPQLGISPSEVLVCHTFLNAFVLFSFFSSMLLKSSNYLCLHLSSMLCWFLHLGLFSV